MSSQSVREFMSRGFREQKFLKPNYQSVVAYPQNNVRELAKIMNDIRMESLPVLSSPWNKKIVGVIELNKIKVFLND